MKEINALGSKIINAILVLLRYPFCGMVLAVSGPQTQDYLPGL